MKQGDAFQYCFGICHQEGPKNQEGMKLNGTHRLVAYANNVNIVGEHLYMIQKNTEALLDASKKVDLEVNPEKTYMCVDVTLYEGRTEAQHKDSK
jgi:hypothetical protein